MAIEKALDFSNPMVVSRVNLERVLDKFQKTIARVGITRAKKRLKNTLIEFPPIDRN